MLTKTKDLVVGAIIKGQRDALGMTQAELAARLGYDYSNFIAMLERGRSKLPLNMFLAVAHALDIDEMCLLERVLEEREECQDLHIWLFGPGGKLRPALDAAWGEGA